MALILQEANENVDYYHKKFNQRKRSSARTNPTPTLTDTENQGERVDTPLSISSGTDSDNTSYTSTFVSNVACVSTPLAKRRKLQPMTNINSLNQHNDSGIALTPQSHHAHHPDRHEDDNISTVSNSEHARCTPRTHHSRANHPVATSTPTPPPAPITPIGAILPKISDQTLRSICKYHGNMVRKFPKKQRTPKDQERRNKNTIACRMSRRVKKLEHVAIEEQYKEFSAEHSEIVEASIRASAYLHELMKLSAVGCESEEESSGVKVASSKMLQQRQEEVAEQASSSFCAQQEKQEPQLTRKRSFSIAFLIGSEQH